MIEEAKNNWRRIGTLKDIGIKKKLMVYSIIGVLTTLMIQWNLKQLLFSLYPHVIHQTGRRYSIYKNFQLFLSHRKSKQRSFAGIFVLGTELRCCFIGLVL